MTDTRNPFRVVLRGYEPAQVDRRIAELAEEAASARSQADALEARSRELEEAATRAAEDRVHRPVSFSDLGERVGQILTLAEEEGEELIARARTEAAEERARAGEAATKVREEADRYSEQCRSEAEVEAARILEAARRSADERLDGAERDAAARLQEAEAVYEAQRAKAAAAAADFETTLARRRKKAEEDFALQIQEAQQRLEDLEREIERSRSEAQQQRADAAREARQLMEDAQQQAAATVEEAKASADRVRADSERELAAATQRRDSINAQLANVRHMLVTLTGASSVGALEAAVGADTGDESGQDVDVDAVTDMDDADTTDPNPGEEASVGPESEPQDEAPTEADSEAEEVPQFTPFTPQRIQ